MTCKYIPLISSLEAAAKHGVTSPSPTKTRASRNRSLLKIAPCEEDLDALKPLLSAWLVPLLVREFLAEHIHDRRGDSNHSTSGVVCKEVAR
jgi:hypothetical protein